MKKSVMRGFAAALVVVAVGGCGKQESGQAQEAENAQEARVEARASDALPASVARSSLIIGQTWTVCGIVGNPSPHHYPPPMGEKFEIVETVNNSGVYALKLENSAKWDAGWGALTLVGQGTEPARIPHDDWTATCKPGDKSQARPFAPRTDTKRFRGATCLPNGTLRLAERTCSTGQEHFHEIIIYVHEAAPGSNDIRHMMLQYCGKDELDTNNQLVCDDPQSVPSTRNPHPGHVHIDP